jgi:hypothetical protein
MPHDFGAIFRVWSEADQSATSNLLETSTSKIRLLLNGVHK